MEKTLDDCKNHSSQKNGFDEDLCHYYDNCNQHDKSSCNCKKNTTNPTEFNNRCGDPCCRPNYEQFLKNAACRWAFAPALYKLDQQVNCKTARYWYKEYFCDCNDVLDNTISILRR